MRLLVIESDTLHRESVSLMLRADGWAVETAEDAEEGIDIASRYDFGAIVVGLELPDLSGPSALRAIRAGQKAPILALSKDVAVDGEVSALAAGADDYLRKPFHRAVLGARLNALVRRAGGHADPVIRFGPLALNTVARTLQADGVPINLTGREYQLLEAMALRAGHTFTKGALLDHMYGGLDEPAEKIVDVFICKIRNKLRAHGAAEHIETVWGRGYRVVNEPTPYAWQPAAHVEPRGYQAEIVARLATGPATFPQLWALFPLAPQSSIRGALYTLIHRGEVANLGDPRSTLYALTKVAPAAA